MLDESTSAERRATNRSPVIDGLGLSVVYRYPAKLQALVDEAASGSSDALLRYAKALEELAGLHSLGVKDPCLLIEPVAALAAAQGGVEARLFLAGVAERLGDALAAEEGLSEMDSARMLASWWQAAAIYEELAREEHPGSLLADLLQRLAARGVQGASDALREWQGAI